jgi:hypothetical protein
MAKEPKVHRFTVWPFTATRDTEKGTSCVSCTLSNSCATKFLYLFFVFGDVAQEYKDSVCSRPHNMEEQHFFLFLFWASSQIKIEKNKELKCPE